MTLQHSVGSRSVLRWLLDGPSMALHRARNRVAIRAAVAQARARLSDRPLRWVFEHLARPLASAGQPGASDFVTPSDRERSPAFSRLLRRLDRARRSRHHR